MIIAILSILILTGIIWGLNKKLPMQICPICAGVTLTWLWMFLGMFLGKLLVVDYQVPTAILAGGTVVGLMSKLEDSIRIKFALIWKTVFTVSGFGAVYGLFTNRWLVIAVGIIIATVSTILFRRDETNPEYQQSEQIKALKEKMKNCC